MVFPVLQERIGFGRPYLKIDTQGFDIEVLRGAGDSLPAVRALQTEASVRRIYKGMPRYTETIRYLDERGLDITGLYPVSWDSAQRTPWFTGHIPSGCVQPDGMCFRRCSAQAPHKGA